MRSYVVSGVAMALLAGCGSTGGSASPDASLASEGGGHSSSSSKASGGQSSTATTGMATSSTRGGGGSSATSGGDGGAAGSSSSSGTSSGGDAGAVVGASVLTFHDHVNRDGLFVDPAITSAAAAGYTLDSSFAGTFSGDVYASPLYVEDGASGKGTFYVATQSDTVYALDEATGAVVWHTNVGSPATSTNGAGCGNVNPIGITGTPAIDLATRLIVFDAAIASSNGNLGTHEIFALSIDTGDVAWSFDTSTLAPDGGVAFTPPTQNQRGAALILNGVAYFGYGGQWGDCGTYYGWVIGVPLSGKGAMTWTTTNSGAGIWGVGGPASDGESIFVTTGNGKNDMATWTESEGIFRLSPNLTFSTMSADYFAPYDWSYLDDHDLDISGSGALVIDAPSMTPSELVLGQGKDGYLYLVNRQNLGGIATMSQLANVGALQLYSSGGQITNGGAFTTVNGTTYVVVRPNGQNAVTGCPNGTSGDLAVVKLSSTAAQKMTLAWCAKSGGVGSPSITSTDGSTNALVWVFAADPNNAALLYAWDLETGAQVFAGGGATNKAANVRRFTTPIAVHGRVFVGGDGRLYAWKAG